MSDKPTHATEEAFLNHVFTVVGKKSAANIEKSGVVVDVNSIPKKAAEHAQHCVRQFR